jgi:hypothetical protein
MSHRNNSAAELNIFICCFFVRLDKFSVAALAALLQFHREAPQSPAEWTIRHYAPRQICTTNSFFLGIYTK